MSFFKKLFGNNNDIEEILNKYERGHDFYNIHFECYIEMLNNITSKEKEIIENGIGTHILVKLMRKTQNRLSPMIEWFKGKESFNNKDGLKIIFQTLQDIYDKGYVDHYLKFMTMDVLETSYKTTYKRKDNIVDINFKKLAEPIILSVFSNIDVFLELSNESRERYNDIIQYSAKHHIKAEDITMEDNGFDATIWRILYHIKNRTKISEEQVKRFTLEGMNNLIINLGVERISQGLEHTLFFIIRTLGFNGGLNQIPSFHLIALAQTKRDMNNEDYLPTLDINLTKNEKFICDKEAIYRKLRNEKQRTGTYYGLASSIKIAKGLRFRMGHIVMPKERVEKLEDIDIGNIYLTNKRIVFKGKKKTFSVDINKLLSIELSEYGLLLFKNGNENPYILCLNDEDYYVIGELVSDLLNK